VPDITILIAKVLNVLNAVEPDVYEIELFATEEDPGAKLNSL
jgi:hypothetical protein